MASPLPCDSCGSPIADSDLETGNAITLLGRRYCAGCKTEAIQSVSLDELNPKAAGAKPAAKPAAPARPPAASKAVAPRPAPKAPSPKPEVSRPAPARRSAAPAPRPASSKTPIFIGIGAVVLIAAAAGAFFLKGSPESPDPTRGGSGSGKTPGKGPVADAPDPATQAREAFLKVDELVRRGGASPDLILAAIEKAKPACSGTEWAKKLEDLRVRAAEDKKTEDASKEITPLLDELKGAVAGDPEFKRFGELQPKFQLALEMAGRTGSAKMSEIRALQADYNGRYEKLAEPYYNDINEAATQLAEERRFDDALKKINSFPQHLRNSKAWHSLERLKKDIESRKKK